jgi:mannan endo-1,6-alpha-mannosidase
MLTAIANGCFFNLGARLARYTGNETYAKYAEETWDWLWAVNYIDHDSWLVYDGGHVGKNCTDINKATFSYNAAILLQGAAFMYNFVSSPTLSARYTCLYFTDQRIIYMGRPNR